MSISAQRPYIPSATLGVLQARPTPARTEDAAVPANPNRRERPMIDATPAGGSGTAPRRGQFVNILV